MSVNYVGIYAPTTREANTLDMGFTLLGFRDVEIPSPTLVARENGNWNMEMKSYSTYSCQYWLVWEGCEVLLCFLFTSLFLENLSRPLNFCTDSILKAPFQQVNASQLSILLLAPVKLFLCRPWTCCATTACFALLHISAFTWERIPHSTLSIGN